jgi:hypothetical protein
MKGVKMVIDKKWEDELVMCDRCEKDVKMKDCKIVHKAIGQDDTEPIPYCEECHNFLTK